MNHFYRLVISRTTGTLIAVAETTRGAHKNKSLVKNAHAPFSVIAAPTFLVRPICAIIALTFNGYVFALPQNPTINAGSATISGTNNALVIDQTSARLSINWNSFSIDANQSVHFNQKHSDVALNRVTGGEPSNIFGRLSGAGQIFLINSNGILFGKGAQVNVGSLVATTHALSDIDFQAGRYLFTNTDRAGSVINKGSLTAADNGYIAMLAPEVHNDGVIQARLGTALLAAGDKINLTIDNNSLLSFQIEQGSVSALVDNKNLIVADGGRVFMSAKAAGNLTRAVVNNTGVVQARTIENKSGVIRLMADMTESTNQQGQPQTSDNGHGEINLSGTLDASAPVNGNGGFIETSAAQIKINDSTRVTTKAATGNNGRWLIDPLDFTISAGLTAQSASGIGAATLSNNLIDNNITIETDASTGGNGDIFINSAVNWSANLLTLSAHRNINVNANLNGSGTAQLSLQFGQASATGNNASINLTPGVKINLPAGDNYTTKQGSSNPLVSYTVINSIGSAGSTTGTDLQGMALNKNYVLGSDIDASATQAWNGGAGFNPIGEYVGWVGDVQVTTPYIGIFNGFGHTISNLYINRPTTSGIGLFGAIEYANIKNIHLINTNVTGNKNVGGLIGYASSSTIDYTSSSGVVTGNNTVGGLVGVIGNTTLTRSYSLGTVINTGPWYTGGLVGSMSNSTIDQSYSAANTSGYSYVGGLVGGSFSYNTHPDGSFFANKITNSYASGDVTGCSSVGGLVGFNWRALISNSYASGQSIGTINDGGNYAIGGLVGVNQIDSGDSQNIFNSYWNSTLNSIDIGSTLHRYSWSDVVGRTSEEMKHAANFANLDILTTGGTNSIWRIYEGNSQPLLRALLMPLQVSTTYNGTTQNFVSASGADETHLLGTLAQGKNVGVYASNQYSDQQGYDLIGDLTITKALITISAADLTRNYDGTINANASAIAIIGTVFAGDSITNSTFAFTNKNVGTSKTITLANSTIGNDSNTDNYTIAYANNSTSTINKSQLTLTSSTVSRTYDGTSNALASSVVTGTLFIGDSITNLSFAFDNKNTGVGKTIYTSGATVGDSTNFNNYNITYTNNVNGTIDQAHITLNGNVTSRTYNGTSLASNATLASGTVFGGDSLVGGTFVFNDKNVGTTKTITGSGAVVGDGSANANYNIHYASNTLGTITQAYITLDGSVTSRTYNATTSGSSATLAVGTIFGGDSLVGGTFRFNDKNVGTTKTITGNGAIIGDGSASANYNIHYATNTLGTISPAELILRSSGFSRTYDGTSLAGGVATVAVGTLFAGDSIVGGTFTFNDKNVGVKRITVEDVTVGDGDNLNNYHLVYASAIAGSISQAQITLDGSVTSRVYNATTSGSSATLSSGTIFNGDSLVSGTFTFNDKNAGTTKTITGTGATVSDGSASANYNIHYATNTLGTISQAALTITANNANKLESSTPYTGGNGVTYEGFVAGENTSELTGALAYTGSSQGAIAPGSYAITPGGLSAQNYHITYNNGTLTIAAVPIPITTFIADSLREYTSSAPVCLSDKEQITKKDATDEMTPMIEIGINSDSVYYSIDPKNGISANANEFFTSVLPVHNKDPLCRRELDNIPEKNDALTRRKMFEKTKQAVLATRVKTKPNITPPNKITYLDNIPSAIKTKNIILSMNAPQ